MKKTHYSPMRVLLLTLLFFAGMAFTADAQFKILNNTGCTIYFKVAQHNNLTAVPCDGCNASGTIALLPGAQYTHPALNSCGPEFWYAFKWYTLTPNSYGVSYNPLGPACGTDITGTCGINPINVTWFFSSATGAGPVKVLLN